MTDSNSLTAIDMGIDTHQEPVLYMRADCPVCQAEGFAASSRVQVTANSHSIIATLNVVDDRALDRGFVGLSKSAFRRLQIKPGDRVSIHHAPLLQSLHFLRKKIFGHALQRDELFEIISDISNDLYSDIEIASFLTGCAGGRLNIDEITALTQAMVACGERLDWPGHGAIYDKHCIGGLPGNRTSPLVVAIVSAAGLVIPKTSSRAITSPAGTADTVETLMPVTLGIAEMRRIVSETGACLAWGGAVNLSPADDLLIRIERALDIDGEGQLIASVLSKKIAAGSTHVVIDIPVGPTAKIRSTAHADRLASLFAIVGEACDLQVRCVMTDGTQPVGRGIGPAEEARDLLAVLRREPDAPADLRERALLLSAHLLDMARSQGLEHALATATDLLDSGHALQQFERIAAAQGGLRVPPEAHYRHEEVAADGGVLTAIDNRKLTRLARLAGAPNIPAAGIRLHARVGDQLQPGQPLFTLFSESRGEREYALEYLRRDGPIFQIAEPV